MIPSRQTLWCLRRIAVGINDLQLYLTEWSDGGNSQEKRESGQDGHAARYDECAEDVNMRCSMTGIWHDMVKYESGPVLHLSVALLIISYRETQRHALDLNHDLLTQHGSIFIFPHQVLNSLTVPQLKFWKMTTKSSSIHSLIHLFQTLNRKSRTIKTYKRGYASWDHLILLSESFWSSNNETPHLLIFNYRS